jgi:hypothetical protein
MLKHRIINSTVLSSLIAAATVTVANTANAETLKRNCPFSCRTIGLSNDPSCHDYRRDNQCFVQTDGKPGITSGDDSNSNGSSSTSGLRICLRTNGSLTVRGRCKSGETLISQSNLPEVSDINLSGVPSGSTITGVVGAMNQAPTVSSSFSSTASLGAKISPALASESIIVASSSALTSGCAGSPINCLASEETSTNSVCTGTALSPSAPTGKLCIYPTSVTNSSSIFGAAMANSGASAGFTLSWTAPAAGTTTLQAIWAYTAP